MNICRFCRAKCCKYFGLQIDTPKTKHDFENIRWFLAHRDVAIFVDKRKWFIELYNDCKYLTKDHRCNIYDIRPTICKEHEIDTCEHVLESFGHDKIFNSMEEFDVYLEERFGRKKRKKK